MVKRIDLAARLELAKLDMDEVSQFLGDVNDGSMNDINNVSLSLYYRFLPALVKAIKPKQVIEMGSAGGASVLMMLSVLPETSKLYAMSLKEPEGEFRFIKKDYLNLELRRGDNLNLDNWKGVDLKKTDLWFLDTKHTFEQLHKEMELYDPYFKKGAIVLLDDIRLNSGMTKAWNEIKYNKLSLPDLHWSGFGMFQV